MRWAKSATVSEDSREKGRQKRIAEGASMTEIQMADGIQFSVDEGKVKRQSQIHKLNKEH